MTPELAAEAAQAKLERDQREVRQAKAAAKPEPLHSQLRKGRKPGSKNRTSAELRNELVLAYLKAGGVKALAKFAKAEPGEFYRIFARLIPAESHVSGDFQFRSPVSINEARDALASRVTRVIDAEPDQRMLKVVNE